MTSSNTGKYRLLAVDDDKDSTELIVRNALRCGYECFSVYDAHTLGEIIPHWRPHVITLDLCLPDVKRFETISMLDAARFSGDLIIISGQPDWYRKEAADFAVHGGLKVTADLPKPLQIAELRNVLNSIKSGLLQSLLDEDRSPPQPFYSPKL
jgi:two-component system chemotaxis response regulator CheY